MVKLEVEKVKRPIIWNGGSSSYLMCCTARSDSINPIPSLQDPTANESLRASQSNLFAHPATCRSINQSAPLYFGPATPIQSPCVAVLTIQRKASSSAQFRFPTMHDYTYVHVLNKRGFRRKKNRPYFI